MTTHTNCLLTKRNGASRQVAIGGTTARDWPPRQLRANRLMALASDSELRGPAAVDTHAGTQEAFAQRSTPAWAEAMDVDRFDPT